MPPKVYQRSGTGNQFSNAVWAYSLQQWSTGSRHAHPRTRGHQRVSPCVQAGIKTVKLRWSLESKGQLLNIIFSSVGVVSVVSCHYRIEGSSPEADSGSWLPVRHRPRSWPNLISIAPDVEMADQELNLKAPYLCRQPSASLWAAMSS